MEPMNVHFISAVCTTDGTTRARVRVESKAQHRGVPRLTMHVVLSLPAEIDNPTGEPSAARVYDEVLRYLDIA